MSIAELILSRCAEGKLQRLNPSRLSDAKRRALYLTPQLASEVFSEPDDEEKLDDLAFLEQEMHRFTSAKNIEECYFKMLAPKSKRVWELKATDGEDIHLRVFGVFAEKDVFVAMSYAYRADLGDKDSYEWKRQISYTRKMWDHLFPGHSPKGIETIQSLVTGVIDDD